MEILFKYSKKFKSDLFHSGVGNGELVEDLAQEKSFVVASFVIFVAAGSQGAKFQLGFLQCL
jgi:hypothetical protein